MDKKTMGIKIKKLRLLRGFKQDYMALQIGISQTGFSKIETGETNITLERALTIADVFNMTLSEFLDWEEEKEA